MKKVYCCSLYDDKEVYFNEQFESLEEAKAEGIKCIKEYNAYLEDPTYGPDEEVFVDELIGLLEMLDFHDRIPEAIEGFYLLEFEIVSEEEREAFEDYIFDEDILYGDEIIKASFFTSQVMTESELLEYATNLMCYSEEMEEKLRENPI